MAIYAILGVEYYSEFGTGSECGATGFDTCFQTVTISGEPPDNLTSYTTNVDSNSIRAMPYGFEYYGTFFRALYTLFQVLTGESWSEAVARPLIFGQDNGRDAPAWFSAIYFSSFIVITQIVLVNVVVAVLLDKFVTTDESDKSDGGAAAERELKELQLEVQQLREGFETKVEELAQTLDQVLGALQQVTSKQAAASTAPPSSDAGAVPRLSADQSKTSPPAAADGLSAESADDTLLKA